MGFQQIVFNISAQNILPTKLDKLISSIPLLRERGCAHGSLGAGIY